MLSKKLGKEAFVLPNTAALLRADQNSGSSLAAVKSKDRNAETKISAVL